MKFFQFIIQMIYQPKVTIEKMAKDEKINNYGSLLIIVFSIIYTFTVKQFDSLGLIPVVDQLMIFPSDHYYYYESFIIFPVTLGAVIINYGLNKKIIIQKNYTKNLWGMITFATLIPALIILWFYETVFIVILSLNVFVLDVIRITIWVGWTIYLTNLVVGEFQQKQMVPVKASIVAIFTLGWMVLFFR